MKLIDIHAHLDFKDYDADRAEVIKRTREAECGVINVGVDLETSKAVIKLAEENDLMWATVGLHPTDCQGQTLTVEEWAEFEKLAAHDKVVAIGECGLDYFRLGEELGNPISKGKSDFQVLKEKQKEIFEKQIELAMRLDKPLMLHVRDVHPNDREVGRAYDDVLEILKNYPGVRGNAHFFAGNWDQAKQFLDLGFTLSFTGVITFPQKTPGVGASLTPGVWDVIKNAPLDRIMAETDSPFVAPAPYRGQRNEPLYVAEVARKIAGIKDLSPEIVSEQLLKNAHCNYKLGLVP